jgi:hypothetical protein
VLGRTRGRRSRWSGRRAAWHRWGSRGDDSRAAPWSEAAAPGEAPLGGERRMTPTRVGGRGSRRRGRRGAWHLGRAQGGGAGVVWG